MLAKQHYAAASAALALALCTLTLIVFHPHDDATELLMKGKKKSHGLAVKYYLDKGLSGKMGHKVFTQLMSDGLQVTDIQEGKGLEAKVGDLVKYSGKLANGKEFDKGTISFPLGRHKVIKGWDQGLMHVKTGCVCMLHIPPTLAYGKKGNAKIPAPADSTLLFSVKLLHVQKAGAKKGAVGGKKPFWQHAFKGHAHTLAAQRKAEEEKRNGKPGVPKFSLTHII